VYYESRGLGFMSALYALVDGSKDEIVKEENSKRISFK
jgi:hypothetical protein